MNLVIVESPTKARKLKSYLGGAYTVEASVGHVRDLPKKSLGIDLENNYQPLYEVSSDKKKVVSKLRKLAREADAIYLAMDPDREGEAIAWHIKYLLEHDRQAKKSETTKRNYLRSTFYEITKPAVLKAIAQPSTINLDLVNAQQARRVLDRLVGYKVSPVLWKKVRRGLSAGRVQSVALRMIVEREREIEAFKSDEYWEFAVALAIPNHFSATELARWQKKEAIFSDNFELELPKEILILSVEKVDNKKLKIDNEQDAKQVVADLDQAQYQVKDLKQVERRRQSLPPFTTSLLQQSAANRFGFSAKQTMSLAQRLYEEGLITYHRTDAFYLAKSAVESARQYIAREFGAKYVPEKPRYFSQKNKNSQEAHEAIRATDLSITKENLQKVAKLTANHIKLYDLIWRRFLASQMSDAVYDQTTILVSAKVKDKKKEYELKVVGSVMKFPGWRRLFNQKSDLILPEVKVKQDLIYLAQNPLQKFTQPPARYNDASLIKELEKKGIGRPSTYASIISVIIQRGYVEREARRFFATPIGVTVSDFLLEHFQVLMDYDFTATIEASLDQIAEGKKAWTKVVDEFYQPLAKRIEAVTKEAERVAVPVEKTGKPCPECAKLVAAGELEQKDAGEVVIRSGRYGKFKSCSRFPDCKYTENLVETLGDQLCPLCQKAPIVIKNTRWGKSFYGCADYPQCQWASWKKPAPGLKLTQAEWKEIQAKRVAWKAKRAQNKANKAKSKSQSKSKKTSKKSVAKSSKKQKKSS